MNFVVARNPDPDSRLPYLVRLPIDGGLILKVRDTWPRTSRVFCARVDGGWPADAEIVEEVPVTLWRRRGVAIDLILDRPREFHSQFVFTTLPSGREGIFWQTRKVVTTARPGARIPGRRVFLETRPLAEEWTFRYLGAALAEYESERQTAPQVRAAELPTDYEAVGPPPREQATEGRGVTDAAFGARSPALLGRNAAPVRTPKCFRTS
jgi:hypothetical protein